MLLPFLSPIGVLISLIISASLEENEVSVPYRGSYFSNKNFATGEMEAGVFPSPIGVLISLIMDILIWQR